MPNELPRQGWRLKWRLSYWFSAYGRMRASNARFLLIYRSWHLKSNSSWNLPRTNDDINERASNLDNSRSVVLFHNSAIFQKKKKLIPFLPFFQIVGKMQPFIWRPVTITLKSSLKNYLPWGRPAWASRLRPKPCQRGEKALRWCFRGTPGYWRCWNFPNW